MLRYETQNGNSRFYTNLKRCSGSEDPPIPIVPVKKASLQSKARYLQWGLESPPPPMYSANCPFIPDYVQSEVYHK